MNIRTMRFIDKYLGTVICALLTVFDRFSSAIRGRREGGLEVRNILMIKFWGMGSIILASPAIMAIKERYPKAKLHFLTFRQNKDICDSLGVIDEVITINPSSTLSFISSAFGGLTHCRRLKLDLAIDLEFLARFSSIMTYLSGAKKTVEFYSNILWRGELSKIPVPYNYYFHVTDNFMNLVRVVGIEEKARGLLRPQADEAALKSSRAMLQEEGISDRDKVVAVNINSSDMARERRWPKEKFAFLVNGLLKEYPVRIVLTGGREDKGYVKSFINSVKNDGRVVNLAGKLNIKELIAVLERSSLLISNDSGPLHIAEALGIPTVSFFGPETPVLYGPQGGEHLVYYKKLLCSPCMNIHNNKLVNCMMDNKCMTGIDAREVLADIKDKYGPALEVRA